MQRDDVTRARVRALAEADVEGAKVLSVYLNLDPGELGTRPARATAIRSVLDEAARAVRESEGLTHDEQAGLRADVERLESYFGDTFSAEGVHGLAVFSSSPGGLFEVIRLPEAPQTRVVVADAPYIEPLVRAGMEPRWVVLLVSRANGRVLRGSSTRLAEVRTLDENVHQQHSQGGWSQAGYERSVDEDARRHVARVIAALQEDVARRPFDLLLYAGPDELGSAFIEEQLGEELRGRLAGRFSCDVSNTSPGDVLEAAHDAMLMAEARRERETLDRLADALGMGAHASSSLDRVLEGLVERRVETLLLDPGFSAPGVSCPTCGWLGMEGTECPVDGSRLVEHDDVTEIAIEAAETQSAEITFVQHHPDLQAYGGIASIDRF
jgi:peptide chain release factor subunit 1